MKIPQWAVSGTKGGNDTKPTSFPAYRYRLSPVDRLFRASEQRPLIPLLLGFLLALTVGAVVASYRPLPFGPVSAAALALLAVCVVGTLLFYARFLAARPVTSPQMLSLLGAVPLLATLINRFLLIILVSLSQSFPFIPLHSFY